MNERLDLRLPTYQDLQAITRHLNEFMESRDDVHGAGPFLWVKTIGEAEEALKKVSDYHNGIVEDESRMPATTLLLIRKEDKKILGTFDIRHTLNDYLFNFGGHIGYSIRPSERQKGYAKQGLMQTLEYCRSELNLREVLLICLADNVASKKTIEACGGIFEKEFIDDDGLKNLRYWITL